MATETMAVSLVAYNNRHSLLRFWKSEVQHQFHWAKMKVSSPIVTTLFRLL